MGWCYGDRLPTRNTCAHQQAGFRVHWLLQPNSCDIFATEDSLKTTKIEASQSMTEWRYVVMDILSKILLTNKWKPCLEPLPLHFLFLPLPLPSFVCHWQYYPFTFSSNLLIFVLALSPYYPYSYCPSPCQGQRVCRITFRLYSSRWLRIRGSQDYLQICFVQLMNMNDIHLPGLNCHMVAAIRTLKHATIIIPPQSFPKQGKSQGKHYSSII